MRAVVADGSLDQQVLGWFVDHRAAWATWIARTVMAVGTTPAALAVCALTALGFVVLRRAYRPAVAVVVSVVVAAVAAGALKQVFGRARPPAELALVQAGGTSFPSTQAAQTAAAVAAMLVAVRWPTARATRRWSACLAVVLVAVGACLVYLGAHWPSDVLAGWLLGALLGSFAGLLLRPPRDDRSTAAADSKAVGGSGQAK